MGEDLQGSLELSIYCDHYLRLVENEEETEEENRTSQATHNFQLGKINMIKSEFPATVIEELLKAMNLNSYEARRRFPRLLQIVELYKEQTLEVFVKNAEKCPSWMFIGWLSQMTALLDKPEAKAIYKIIESITNEYPQAIVYPFKMSLDSFKFDYSTREQQSFVEKIKGKLKKIPLVNQFVAALEQLNSPELLFKDYLAEVLGASKENHFQIFPRLYFDLIDGGSSKDEARNFGEQVEWGNIRKAYSKELKIHFNEEFGTNAQQLSSLTEAVIKEKMKKINGKVASLRSEDGNLGQFSPWLVAFKRNAAKDIEIPGN